MRDFFRFLIDDYKRVDALGKAMNWAMVLCGAALVGLVIWAAAS